jgi:hypothetical protein
MDGSVVVGLAFGLRGGGGGGGDRESYYTTW